MGFPGEDILIPSGIKVEIPEHTALIGVDKSGVASSSAAKAKAGMPYRPTSMPSALIVGAKLIDADYSGELHIHIINVGKGPVTIEPGCKIAQFVLIPVLYDRMVEVPEIEMKTGAYARGSGGFGSTNK